MKVFIITNNTFGTTNFFLRDFVCKYTNSLPDSYEIGAVILVGKGGQASFLNRVKRRVKKIIKIGVLGAVLGVYLRRFYDKKKFRSMPLNIDILCTQADIDIKYFASYKDIALQEFLSQESYELGLSLGNSYIPKKIFGIPKNGMLNIHHELLPDLPNAQSIIWSIYHERTYSGLTLHRVSSKIDEGEIMASRRIELEKYPGLGETIRYNYERLISETFSLFDNYMNGKHEKIEGSFIEKHTTPSLNELITIYRNWELLLKKQH